MSARTVWTFNFIGWVLFTVSALLFLWSTGRAGDMVGFLASLAFFIACIFFLIPVWRLRPAPDDRD